MIYVRGTGQGERGPEADRGSYDSLAYWCRSGIAVGMRQPEYDYVPAPPAPAFGDSIGAMTIAGGIMGALFHRERTDEATTVDVSLLGIGLWSMGAALALSLQHGVGWTPPPPHAPTGNPLTATYTTKDGNSCRSRACRRRSTGPRSARSSADPSSPPTSASPTRRGSGRTSPSRPS
jgi:crotonobetainyl-CoA:carnitine CoA-transferase CaiB-like acyl-CoA transferase